MNLSPDLIRDLGWAGVVVTGALLWNGEAL